ncbi:hypothetical protein FKW77_004889 [Venturia effusa]|uniref:AB hydrolase-1 domain-containing protein n=1 Tax=Venturia effusa TaxID=50376 RepID=A0A517LH47_9PEZI|nr:hypothetical protein FKW77_004889 [Venturia effusa]
MKPSISAIALTALATLAEARQCQNLTIPLQVSARQGKYNLKAPSDDIAVTNFILDLTRQGHNYTNEALAGYQTVSGSYKIAATLCHPDKGPSSTLQILTHGIGFDKSYWDFPHNNYNYSYVNRATDKYGYSTFFFDRLGIGMSSRGEPINEIQASLEIAALQTLTTMFRNGTLPGGSKYRPTKIVHVGHSFGAIQSYSLAVLTPQLSDGLILTGFAQNATFVPFFELGGNFILAKNVKSLASYPVGYLAAGDASSVQTNFFAPGVFDPAVLALATATGQPVTPGELLTLGGLTGIKSPFTGPVLVIIGERDIPFCGGDCIITGNPALPNLVAQSKPMLPKVKDFTGVIVPGAGHGLNLEYSHPLTYSTILDYLGAQGLDAAGA